MKARVTTPSGKAFTQGKKKSPLESVQDRNWRIVRLIGCARGYSETDATGARSMGITCRTAWRGSVTRRTKPLRSLTNFGSRIGDQVHIEGEEPSIHWRICNAKGQD